MKNLFLKKADDYKVQQKYGVIKTSFFKYITPTMITVIVLCGLLISLNFNQVYTNFRTNIPLNSLIFFIFSISMIIAIKNNLNLRNTAIFLKNMEGILQSSIVKDKDIAQLRKMLDTSAYLINTQYTFKLIDNLEKYGHPLVTDNDARLIKSKLGFRVRIQRSSVSFMAGLLVMLGLIGTFWGLLLTIGSVGEAMDTIAKQADSLGTGDSNIGGIISSISEPLQGMGLAFSSSLFGLSGSLVVGFFNYSGGQAQDSAIEDFSRWIDEKIPTVGSKEEELLLLEFEDDKSENKSTEESNIDKDTNEGTEQIALLQNAAQTSSIDETLVSQVLFTLKQSVEVNRELKDNFSELLSFQHQINKTLQLNLDETKNMAVQQKETKTLTKSLTLNMEESVKTQKQISQIGDDILYAQNQQSMSMMENQKLSRDILSRFDENFSGVIEHIKRSNDILTESRIDTKEMIAQSEQLLDKIAHANRMIEISQQTDERIISQNQQLIDGISGISLKIPEQEYEMIRKACMHISYRIKTMDNSLQENVTIMKEVASEGNIGKMASLVKDMQLLWAQVKHNTYKMTHNKES